MLFVIISYLGTSLLIKLSFSDKAQDQAESFNKPLFISYTACSSFSVYILRLLYELIFKSGCKLSKIKDKDMRKIELKTALICYSIFFTSLAMYYFCLSYTSYSSTIILGNTSSIFVFIFSLLILREAFSFLKLIAMLACAIGVSIIAFSDNEESEGTNQVLGDILGVIGAALLGLYFTMLTKLITAKIEERISFFNILAFIGILSMITFWPLIIIFHYTGIELFMLPKGNTITYLFINIIFGTLLFDYCWGRATILIGPLLSNTSVILVVPIGMIIDSFFIKTKFDWKYYLGTILIIIGFFIIAFKNYLVSKETEQNKTEKLESKKYNEEINNSMGESCLKTTEA